VKWQSSKEEHDGGGRLWGRCVVHGEEGGRKEGKQ